MSTSKPKHRVSDYYRQYKEKTAKTVEKKQSPARERQNVLSRQHGYLYEPKDFQWLEKNIPCQAACPAKTDIPGYLDAIAHGNFDEAYRIDLRDNIFPAVLGRVCTRPCEPACRHGWEGLGEPVAICFSKRSASDFLQRQEPIVLEPIFPKTGKKIAVIGGGVAGLSAARELALWGHEVKVYEKHAKPGGMMIQGIPHFRLPREIIDLEIEQIRRIGVEIICNILIGEKLTIDDLLKENDAVIVATGTVRPTMPDLPGVQLAGVRHGLNFLREVNETGQFEIGEKVVVVGGGFTAVDCARSALRLGAKNVRMCYRRSAEEMYITMHEVDEMLHEGIAFETLMSPVEFIGHNGRVTAVKFVRTQMSEPDASGRRTFTAIPGSEFDVPADTVLLGTGQTQDVSWLGEKRPNIFMAGDVVTGARSLIDAIAHGKTCARSVDTYLMKSERLKDVGFVEDAETTGRTREMDAIPRQAMPLKPVALRTLKAEVETGYVSEMAKTEASRCYLCHYKFEIDNDLCIYCDRCLKVKPVENCIVKISSLIYDQDDRIVGFNRSTSNKDYNMLFIDQSQCIRCGACKDVCPVECISLQKVSACTVITNK